MTEKKDDSGESIRKSTKEGSGANVRFDPCAESQSDGVPCPSPEENCEECGRGIPCECED